MASDAEIDRVAVDPTVADPAVTGIMPVRAPDGQPRAGGPWVGIEVQHIPVINFALQQNDVPLVRELKLTNLSEQVLEDIVATVAVSGVLTPASEQRLARLSPGETRRLVKLDLALDPHRLANQLERERAQISVTVSDASGELGRWTAPIDVLAFNEWPGVAVLQEILAAFVSPNHPAIEQFLGAVRQHLNSATGDPSLSGYQTGAPSRTLAVVDAVYEALRSARIGYVTPPASYEDHGQKVRSAAEVLDGSRLGTCLDLSLVAAAVLEQCGLHPLVMLIKGHAFVGAWLRDEQFAEPAIDDASRITNRIRLGDIVVFETTSVCDGRHIAFADAVRLGTEHFAATDEFLMAVDIRAARRAGIRPLPPRVKSGDGFAVVQTPPPGSSDGGARSPGSPSGSDRADGAEPGRTVVPRRRENRTSDLGLAPEAAQRLDTWKRRLLDLSLRNPLLNFRTSAKKVIPLLVPDIAGLEDQLAGGKLLQLAPRSGVLDPRRPRDLSLERDRTGRDIPAEMLREELARGLLRADLTDTFETSAVELFRAARLAVEETGTNTLFLALGTLHWFESPASETRRVAPLVLVPVKLERPSPGQFRISALDEEVKLNVTLLEKLSHDLGIDTSPVLAVGEDENGFDVRAALDAFTRLIVDVPRWEVKDSAHLGLFSFAKFMLYADLDERLAAVAGNEVVRQILNRAAEASDAAPFPVEGDLDRRQEPEAVVYPMDADSSQAAAVEAALAGKAFVLQGPPGTGKSQTITNLIARAAFSGKRVLFVAEKKAALEVVERRLTACGLGPFSLEIHSSKAGKREVLQQLRTALESATIAPPGGWQEEAARLHRLRDRLNDYVRAIHERRSSGESIYQVVSRLTEVERFRRVAPELSDPAGMSADRLSELREAVAQAAVAAGATGDTATHPLRGVRVIQWRLDLADQAEAAISAALGAADALEAALAAWLRALSIDTPADRLTGGEARSMASLAQLALERRCPTRAIIEQPGWDALSRELSALAENGRVRDAGRADLLTRYTPDFLKLDHDAVSARLRAALAAFPVVRWFRRRAAVAPIRAVMAGAAMPDDKSLLCDLATGADVVRRTAALSSAGTPAARLLGSLVYQGEADWADVTQAIDWAGRIRRALATYPAGAVDSNTVKASIVALLDPDAYKFDEASPARQAASTLAAAATSLDQSLVAVKNVLDASPSAMTGGEGDPLVPTLRATLRRWGDALPRLAEWSAWQRQRLRTDVPELAPLLTALDDGSLEPQDATGAFEHGYARAWLTAVLPTEPALRDFTVESRQRLIDQFRETDRATQQLSRRLVAAQISSQVPTAHTATVSPNSEIGVLRRQLSLQRNHKPVRRLVKELPTLLPRLKPVWLMSPLSVAQYLDPSFPPFDLVVFDEASQIPVWDAVGAMARGTRAVVVGDSKQLPPTNFFQSAGEDDGVTPPSDDADIEELESILDECVASAMPELRLKWHYRSRHESLIAFSNHHYYDDQLLTFPSAAQQVPHLGVSMRFFPQGRYDRGGSRTNSVEAQAIVDELFARFAGGDRRTIGIVTFSSAQQILIEDLIDERLAAQPQWQPYFAAGDEPVFVKNLENVQGDERDVILFSICYGPDAAGKVSLGFGPLNRDGGERRLNVAITRAREQVIVFSSIKAESIDLSRSRARGLAHLRTFLDYAERGPGVLREVVTPGGTDDWESPFEMAVCKALRERGWQVDTQVGCSGYRIDLAVRDPDHPGRYLLGIECDGASYHSAKTARDRDRLRQQVLEGLGWRLHRVWSTDWLQNHDRCLERIIAAIDAAQQAAAARQTATVRPLTPAQTFPKQTSPSQASPSQASPAAADGSGAAPAAASPDQAAHLGGRGAPAASGEEGDATPAIELDTLSPDDDAFPAPAAPQLDASGEPFASARESSAGLRPANVVDYVTYDFPGGGRSQDLFYAARAAVRLHNDLIGLVNCQGPVHVAPAFSAIARAWGLSRVTNRVAERLEDILLSAGDSIRRDGDFLWPAGLAHSQYTTVRCPPDGTPPRPLEHICPQEIAAAALTVLREHLGLPASELERATANLLGTRRLNAAARESIQRGIDLLRQQGQCRTDGDAIRLVD